MARTSYASHVWADRSTVRPRVMNECMRDDAAEGPAIDAMRCGICGVSDGGDEEPSKEADRVPDVAAEEKVREEGEGDGDMPDPNDDDSEDERSK